MIDKALGASDFLHAQLYGIEVGKNAILVDTTRFSDEEKVRFVESWVEAGGECDDAESDASWLAPWFWQSEITVRGVTPKEWGADGGYVSVAPRTKRSEQTTKEKKNDAGNLCVDPPSVA